MERISENGGVFVRERAFYKRFLVLTAGLALQNLLAYSVNLMDNVMLGAYSEEALSGAALVNQIQFFLQMLIGAVGNGVVIFGAQYWGKRETEPIKRFLSLGLFLGGAIGVCFLIAMSLFPESILRLLTPEEAVIREALSYLSVVRFTYPVFAVTMVLVAAMRSVEVVRIGYMISASTLVINTALNYCLIFGNLGFPEWGSKGAAAATLCSRAAELFIVLLFIRFRERILSIRWRDLFSATRECVADYIRVASPILLSDGLWGLAMLIQSAVLGHMGQEAIAANSIATIVFQIMSVVAYGSSGAAGIMTGKAVGSGDRQRVIRYTKTFQVLFVGIGLLTGAMIFLSKGWILSLYQVSEETKRLADQFLTVLSVTAIGTSYQVACLTGIVRSGGDTRFVLINDLIFMWGIVLPSSAAAAFFFQFPPVIVFACLKCDQVLKCLVAVVKVNRFNWIKRVTRE